MSYWEDCNESYDDQVLHPFKYLTPEQQKLYRALRPTWKKGPYLLRKHVRKLTRTPVST